MQKRHLSPILSPKLEKKCIYEHLVPWLWKKSIKKKVLGIETNPRAACFSLRLHRFPWVSDLGLTFSHCVGISWTHPNSFITRSFRCLLCETAVLKGGEGRGCFLKHFCGKGRWVSWFNTEDTPSPSPPNPSRFSRRDSREEEGGGCASLSRKPGPDTSQPEALFFAHK